VRVRIREDARRRRSALIGRGLGILSALALIASAVSLPVSAEAQQPPQGASLKINVNGLPAGLEPRITVTGPDGYRSRVNQPGTIPSLAAGQYTVWASSVKDSGGSYWPAPSSWPETWHTSVSVSTAEQAVVDVNYFDYVARDVRVVPQGATESLHPQGHDEELNVLRDVAHEKYYSGEVLVSAPTPVAPNGYIVKVGKIETALDPTLETLSVEAVPLEEAVPEADVDEHEQLATFGQTFESRYVSCKAGGGITVSAELHITPSFTIKVKWGKRKQRSAEIDAQLREEASSQFHSDARLHCELREVPLGPSVALAPHGFVLFFVGPVPVAIKATIGVVADGSVHISGGLTVYAQQKGTLGVHLSLGGENPKPRKDFEPLKGSFTHGVNGSLEVAVVPELRLRLYGLAGPTVGARLSAKLKLGGTHSGLEVCAQLEAHLHIPRFPKSATLKRTDPTCWHVLDLVSG
jgi:hypothetical protein